MAAMRNEIFYIRYLKLACILALLVHVSHGAERKTHDMIYYDIKSFAPCVRRFNATHQIGCTSDFNGNNGVIHVIREVADLKWLLHNGTYQPYVAVLTPEMFNLENVNALLNSEKVNGIMVDHSNVSVLIDQGIGFSPDGTCPNNNFGLYTDSFDYKDCKQVDWNPMGNGLGFMDLTIPVFALTNPEEVQTIIDCYETFNKPDAQGNARPFPQCAAEMYNFMYGAKDSPTCIWRSQRMTNLEASQYCDPLGNKNVFATLLPTNKSNPLKEKSLIVAAAQLDAAGLFYHVSPAAAAENTVSGFVALLAAAQVLGSLNKAVKENMTNIMFTFFQGESYDYIGSSRMVYDMNRGKFPMEYKDDQEQPSQINISTIQSFLEVRQLALPANGRFFAHIDPLSYQSSAQQMIDKMRSLLSNLAHGTNVTVENSTNDQPLPPASFQQFLRNETNISGVVITDHRMEYNNQYYNSRLDLPYVFGINYTEYNDTDELPIFPVSQTLTGIATTIARTLYSLANPGATDAFTLEADVNLVNDLLYCFNHRPNCTRIRAVVNKEATKKSLPNKPVDFYVGVHHENLHAASYLVAELLAYYLGDKTQMSAEEGEKNCKGSNNDKIFIYEFVPGPDFNDSYGYCVKSTVMLSLAVSPAFDSDNPDWNSTIYSTWTESQWGSYYARAFLKPSRSQESVTFSVGMIVLIISLTSAYFVNKRSDDLFP